MPEIPGRSRFGSQASAGGGGGGGGAFDPAVAGVGEPEKSVTLNGSSSFDGGWVATLLALAGASLKSLVFYDTTTEKSVVISAPQEIADDYGILLPRNSADGYLAVHAPDGLTADSAALSGTTTETVMATHTIASGRLQGQQNGPYAGYIRVEAIFSITARAAGTFRARVRLNNTVGGAVVDTGALTVAANDFLKLVATLRIRDLTSAPSTISYCVDSEIGGLINGVSQAMKPNAPSDGTYSAQGFVATGEWSSNNGGNSAVLKAFNVTYFGL